MLSGARATACCWRFHNCYSKRRKPARAGSNVLLKPQRQAAFCVVNWLISASDLRKRRVCVCVCVCMRVCARARVRQETNIPACCLGMLVGQSRNTRACSVAAVTFLYLQQQFCLLLSRLYWLSQPSFLRWRRSARKVRLVHQKAGARPDCELVAHVVHATTLHHGHQ